MDVYEATRIVLSRIQSVDPANASKIMGLLLLQDDHGEKEMIRLAFGPQNLLHSVIAKARTELGLMGPTLNPAFLPLESDLGFGWGHCSYLCKNVGSCTLVHSDGVGSPNCNELLSKSVPPRLAHHFTGGSRLQQSELAQRAAALMMGDDLHKLGRWRPERIDLSAMACPASRQIYLTFPADSIFREEDVSNYFSTYGPVQDVRIPYQQKRMFGFVTFLCPDTVTIILAKGNPHFVCDSRVLVKPYKEKGKVPEKYKSKPSQDGTPTGLDSRDIMDLQLAGRAFQDNTQDVLWKRRFEERVLELQSRRLQLLDVKKHFQPNHPFGQTLVSPRLDNSLSTLPARKRVSAKEAKKGSEREGSDEADTVKVPESLEDRLPDSPFASPTHHFLEFGESADTNGSGSSLPSFESDETTASTSTWSDSFEPFKCQMQSLSLIGMLPGSGGPTCRVGI